MQPNFRVLCIHNALRRQGQWASVLDDLELLRGKPKVK